MAGIVDHACPHGSQPEAEPPQCRDSLDHEKRRQEKGEADAAEGRCVEEPALGENLALQRHDVGRRLRRSEEQGRRDDDLQHQQPRPDTQQAAHRPVPEQVEHRTRDRVDRQDVAGKEQAAMGDPEDEESDHAVAVDAPEWQVPPRRRAHEKAEAHAEHEREKPICLKERQPVHEPERDRVPRRLGHRVGKAVQCREGDILHVHDNDPEQRNKPQIIGHQRAGGLIERACHRAVWVLRGIANRAVDAIMHP
jgi:hypothetical protein